MTERVLIFVCGIVAGLLLGLFLTEDAEAKPPLVIQDEQAITCDSWGWRDNALAASRELGAKVIRVNMYEWRGGCVDHDASIEAIAQAGMKPQLTLAGSLPYMAQKAKQHGALVNTYTVWNEPELPVFACCKAPFLEKREYPKGKGTALPYRKLFPKASRTIKRADPGARVCWGEHSPFGMGGYLKRALKKKPGKVIRADCLAVHPYHWAWTPNVDRKYFKTLRGFKRMVSRLARERRLCRPVRRSGSIPGVQRACRPVPIYNTEYGVPRWDGEAGDTRSVARAYRYCVKLKFRQCAQYQIFPGFDRQHSPQSWNTALTDFNCRPTATYYALRRAVTGRRDLTQVTWPRCPKPIPHVSVPLPPKWGTPLAPPLPPVAPPEPEPVPEVLPDQPPVLVIPPPVPPLEEPPVITLPGDPEPVVEPTPEPPVEPPPVEPPPVDPPVETAPVDPPVEEPAP